MDDIHRFVGEGLFIVYILAMILALIFARRSERPPGWLFGIAHGLLALQGALGLFLWLTDGLGPVPWYHPLLGLLALAALALTPLLRARFMPGMDSAIIFAIVAVLTLAAQLAARLG